MEKIKETTRVEFEEKKIDQTMDNQNSTLQEAIDPLMTCKAEVAQWKERFSRVSADLENFKRRTQKEQQTWFALGQRQMAKDLLEIVDTMELALQDSAQSSEEQMVQGMQLIYKNLQKFLEKFGIQEIVDIKEFNPELHEGLMQVDSDKYESGQIVAILQKGYMLKDEVLRPAKVSVAK
jgi:molecular chaperone GrpE